MTGDVRDLTGRLNVLLEERDRRVARAGGWLTRTDPAWRADWRQRMDTLLVDMRLLLSGDEDSEGS